MVLYPVEEGGGNDCEEIGGASLRQDVVISSSHPISLNCFRIFSLNYIRLDEFFAFSDQCKEE